MEDMILSITNKIPKLEHGQRIILGIDGLSRSGKTTLTKKLVEHLKDKNIQVCLFHIDDYIVEKKSGTTLVTKSGMSITIYNGMLSG